jgi:anti-sigma regulatory factor (Ser/Thr protein kinase)
MEIFLMKYLKQLRVSIEESSGIAEARRQAIHLAVTLNFSEARAAELGLAITEVVTNILKHAGHGYLFIACIEREESLGVEVVAVDAGPGIDSLDYYLQDGNSTAGTYGIGFGTMRRLADEFSIYASQGTAVRLMFWNSRPKFGDSAWELGAISIPIQGEDLCGDQWCFMDDGVQAVIAVADGLGHGPDAAVAGTAAMEAISNDFQQSPLVLMQRANLRLRSTRGAALAIARFDGDLKRISFAGIGNVSMTLLNPEKRYHLVSLSGIVGANPRKVQEFSQEFESGVLLVAHSDGVATRWDLQTYPDLLVAHPSLIASIVFRDFCRVRDDATLVVLRHKG